jgi:regulator of nucleoside diphosphate kinase
MFFTKRIVSEWDHGRLVEAAGRARNSWITYAPYLDGLRAELGRANVVPPARVPEDVVTMNSRFLLRHEHSGQAQHITLVYPEYEDTPAGKVSVLSPMGQAILGARVGDEVCWLAPSGPEVATVVSLLYQPEADARRN